MAIWRIYRRSPLSEEKYPNRNPAWKQALLIIDFQWFTRKGSSTSLSGGGYYTPSQIQPWTGGVGIRGLFLSSDGAIAQMDSIYEYAKNHYPKGSGTTTIRNKMTYSIVGITTPDTSSRYSLIRYDKTGRSIGPHYQVNDSLRTFARSSTWREAQSMATESTTRLSFDI